ncbi:TPA: hypothetical protein ACGOVP_001982 [Streptococcus suis]
MNDKILNNYELLCAELENVVSTLEIAITDIDPDKAILFVTVATNRLKHLVLEHTELSNRFLLSNRFFKEYNNNEF